MDPTVIALIGTIFGGVGLKLAEHWLMQGKVKIDDATRLRDELRLEITALRAENKELEAEVDKWKKEYFDTYAVISALKTEIALHGRDPPVK